MGPELLRSRFEITGAVLCLSAAVVIAALSVAVWQIAHVEGFRVWPISIEGWKPRAERLTRQIADMTLAGEIAAQKALAARLEQERTYKQIAEDVDDRAKLDLSRASTDTERFIAAGGVQPTTGRGSCGQAGASARDNRAGDPEGAGRAAKLDATKASHPGEPADGLVLVTAADVRLCTVNTIKAEAGHELAVQLLQASQPD